MSDDTSFAFEGADGDAGAPWDQVLDSFVGEPLPEMAGTGRYNDDTDFLLHPGDLTAFHHAAYTQLPDRNAPDSYEIPGVVGGPAPTSLEDPDNTILMRPRMSGGVLNYFWEPLDEVDGVSNVEHGVNRIRGARAYPARAQVQLGDTLRSVFLARDTDAYPKIDRIIMDKKDLNDEEITRDVNDLRNIQYEADHKFALQQGLNGATDPRLAARQNAVLEDYNDLTQEIFQEEEARRGRTRADNAYRNMQQTAAYQQFTSGLRNMRDNFFNEAAARDLKQYAAKSFVYGIQKGTLMALDKYLGRMEKQQKELSPEANKALLTHADKVRQVEKSREKWPRGRRGVGYRYGPQGVSKRSPWRTKRMWGKANRDWTLHDVMGIQPVNARVRADAETNIIARRIFGEIQGPLRRMRTVPNAPYTADMIKQAYQMSGLPSVEGIKARKLPRLAKRHTNSIDRILADWKLAAPNVRIDSRTMRY